MFSLKSLLVSVALALCALLYSVFRAWFAPWVRVFWGPFALTSGLYLAIISFQPLQELHYNLPTTQLVMYGIDKLLAPPSGPGPGPIVQRISSVSGREQKEFFRETQIETVSRAEQFQLATKLASDDTAGDARAFLWIAQCLWCLLLAAVAGLACSWFVQGQEDAPSHTK